MGADAKRREERKRKFGTVQDLSAGCLSNSMSRNKHGVASTKKQARLSDNPDKPLPQGFSNGPKDDLTNAGNLPFTTTEASVAQHFAKLQPRAIRHRTTKETGKSKGFAFIEFDGYDRMKTCLQMYHHSDFDDGLSPVRKINVELTAGGGGAKSEERKTKLSNKNERLNEQRKRRALEEGKAAPAVVGSSDHKITDPADKSAIHPSRREMVTSL